MVETYYNKIKKLVKAANEANPEIDIFAERIRGRVPTQAFSDFLTNKEQGDWAEALVLKILNANLRDYESVRYGHSDTLVAGETGFKEFYEKYQDELDKIGKCPDILIFEKQKLDAKERQKFDGSETREEIIDIVRKANCGLEVRSSAFLVNEYNRYMEKREHIGEERDYLSFTPKVEDIAVVLKWIEVHNVPHYYVQVFFDRIYVLSFEKILQIISDKSNLNKRYTIEKNSKNQFKNTIHINIDEGDCLTEDVKLPKYQGEMKKLPRGRLLFYIKFATDELPKGISESKLKSVFKL
jgi:type II restriction enzyme